MNNLTAGEIYQVDNISKSTDFIGFTFNGIHSSELGIVRTSGGNRYQENLFPSLSEQIAQVPGGDGLYYFGTYYTQKIFSISFAFDSLTEKLFRKLKQWLNPKQMGLLTFDEEPYKSYQVKVNDGANIQYICFGEIGERIYKGEGIVQFTAYYPFGMCFKKYLNLYDKEKYTNKLEWSGTSGLLSEQGIYDNIDNIRINLYNPGDLPTDFQAYYKFIDDLVPLKRIYISSGSGTLGLLVFSKDFEKKGEDVFLRIDSETELIEGCDKYKNPTGTLYNEYILNGDFFKIPLTTEDVFVSEGVACENLDYGYLYF